MGVVITNEKPRREKKLLPPRIRAGYLADLLKRMDSKKELPVPKGRSRSNRDTVSWQAYAEANRIDSLTILPQIAEQLGLVETTQGLIKLAKVLAGVIQNTKSHDARALAKKLVEHSITTEFSKVARTKEEFSELTNLFVILGESAESEAAKRALSQLIQRLPDKIRFHEAVLFEISRSCACSEAARNFALDHVPSKKSERCEASALEILAANHSRKDFLLLSNLLTKKKLRAGSLMYCIDALAACGGKRAVPLLRRFIQANKKNRKWEYEYAVESAEMAIEKFS